MIFINNNNLEEDSEAYYTYNICFKEENIEDTYHIITIQYLFEDFSYKPYSSLKELCSFYKNVDSKCVFKCKIPKSELKIFSDRKIKISYKIIPPKIIKKLVMLL